MTLSDLGLLLLQALMSTIRDCQNSDAEMLRGWFKDNPQIDGQAVYKELRYLRAVGMDFGIRKALPKSQGEPTLYAFRKHFGELELAHKAKAHVDESLPYYHFYMDRLLRYEKVMPEIKDGTSLALKIGKVFTTNCGLDDNFRIMTMVTLELVSMQKYTKEIVVKMEEDYKPVP
jgi:hypothetical protein